MTRQGEWKGGIWYPAEVPKKDYPTWQDYMEDQKKRKAIKELMLEVKEEATKLRKKQLKMIREIKEYFK